MRTTFRATRYALRAELRPLLKSKKVEFPLTTSGSFKNWKTGILECVPTANRDEHHSYGANSTTVTIS